jgi:cytochrome c oxidase cbb3-type subunit 3
VSDFWSGWVILLTSAQLVLTVWVLLGNRKKVKGEIKTTGHTYDGLEELDTPLPSWWVNMFLLTVIWSVGYLLLYPGMGSFKGLLNWTAVEQYETRVASAEEQYRAVRDRYLALPVEEIAFDPSVRRMGGRLFGNNCAQCHGSDAYGARGFPNLTDGDWLYGGTPEAIKATLIHGRQAAMPAWQAILGDSGIEEATQYLLSLNQREADPVKAEKGAQHFQSYCAACHGADAQGNHLLGAPNLTNGIWLYGGTAEQIAHTLRNGRNGKMPAFGEVLSEDKIHILTAWVYGLSNRESATDAVN